MLWSIKRTRSKTEWVKILMMMSFVDFDMASPLPRF